MSFGVASSEAATGKEGTFDFWFPLRQRILQKDCAIVRQASFGKE
jgi:hypothetical protein